MIDVQHLKKTFDGKLAVDDVSFSVERGEIFAFLGPNGAGKTTTIRMLTTLIEPDSGTIMLNGHDPRKDADAVRKSFGIVFQDPSLDTELTAEENMEIHAVLYGVPKALYQPRIKELLALVELTERKDDLVKNYSGGMKRRLEIARGLLHHPKVLFLDEPTLGLDPQTRNLLYDYIRRLNKEEEITVFMTTHYMEEADKMAQRIAIIDHGTIVGMGTSQELKTQTNSNTLEDAFLALTGKAIREESAESALRQGARMWGGNRR